MFVGFDSFSLNTEYLQSSKLPVEVETSDRTNKVQRDWGVSFDHEVTLSERSCKKLL